MYPNSISASNQHPTVNHQWTQQQKLHQDQQQAQQQQQEQQSKDQLDLREDQEQEQSPTLNPTCVLRCGDHPRISSLRWLAKVDYIYNRCHRRSSNTSSNSKEIGERVRR